MKVENLDTPPLIRALFYGDSGSGKTTLIGTAMDCPETFPLLVLNSRGQPISLRNRDPRPLVLTLDVMADLNPIYDWMLKGQPRPNIALAKGSVMHILFEYLDGVGCEKFNSLAIDSITHLQRIALTGLTGDPDNPAPIAPGDVPPQAKIQHWGRALAMMTNMADYYFRLPVHVFMSALTRRDHIESMGLMLFAPFLWGQSSLELPSHAEIVGRLCATTTISLKDQSVVRSAFTKKDKEPPFNLLYLAGGRDFIAKWQGVTKPPSVLPSPTIAKLLKYMTRQPEQGRVSRQNVSDVPNNNKPDSGGKPNA